MPVVFFLIREIHAKCIELALNFYCFRRTFLYFAVTHLLRHRKWRKIHSMDAVLFFCCSHVVTVALFMTKCVPPFFVGYGQNRVRKNGALKYNKSLKSVHRQTCSDAFNFVLFIHLFEQQKPPHASTNWRIRSLSPFGLGLDCSLFVRLIQRTPFQFIFLPL